jgi:hypothetical protein
MLPLAEGLHKRNKRHSAFCLQLFFIIHLLPNISTMSAPNTKQIKLDGNEIEKILIKGETFF